MSEQAQALESGGLSDLADFLSDTPELESEEELSAQEADESTADSDTDSEANDDQDIDPEDPDAGEDEPAPVAKKITFKVKGEDGVEETVEASTEELAASYLRQKDYTRKTQALAARENEAVQFLTTKHEEIRSQYLSQAELSRAAIVQMAGIKSESDMAELANSDPAGWVAENQRQRQISNYLNGLSQQIEGEKQNAKAQHQKQQLQKQVSETWEVLTKDGIDKPKLAKIYEGVRKNYGFTDVELGNVYDHRIVRMMKDAAAYQSLKAQKPTVMQKAQDAPRMPSKQTPPANERLDKALDHRFKSGRAKLNDLAAFLR
jgi:hypothetical protein